MVGASSSERNANLAVLTSPQLKRVNTGSAQLASHKNTVAPSGGQNRTIHNVHIFYHKHSRDIMFPSNHMKLYNALYDIPGRYKVRRETPRIATLDPP